MIFSDSLDPDLTSMPKAILYYQKIVSSEGDNNILLCMIMVITVLGVCTGLRESSLVSSLEN